MRFLEKQGGKLRAIFRQGVWPRAEARRDIWKNIERAAWFAALDSGNCVQPVHDAPAPTRVPCWPRAARWIFIDGRLRQERARKACTVISMC